jgi:hypothetical protein
MRLRNRSWSVSTDVFRASTTFGSAVCRKSPNKACASAIMIPQIVRFSPLGGSVSRPFPSLRCALKRDERVTLYVVSVGPSWHARGLTGKRESSTFVLMEVETLGVARSLGWRLHMRCANGYRLETRSMRRCVYRKQLKGASEAKRDTHRRGEHVAPSSFCLVLKRFRL